MWYVGRIGAANISRVQISVLKLALLKEIFVAFLSPSRQLPGQYLELGQV
jgi:hypothetical protein